MLSGKESPVGSADCCDQWQFEQERVMPSNATQNGNGRKVDANSHGTYWSEGKVFITPSCRSGCRASGPLSSRLVLTSRPDGDLTSVRRHW